MWLEVCMRWCVTIILLDNTNVNAYIYTTQRSGRDPSTLPDNTNTELPLFLSHLSSYLSKRVGMARPRRMPRLPVIDARGVRREYNIPK